MNFKELEELANSGIRQISLSEDIFFDGEYIEINANGLTIDGGGHVIDANNESSIFHINADVTLRNIIFKNGYCEYSGGAIVNNGDLTIENCRFEHNYSEDYGGAIYNNSKLLIRKSIFEQNKSEYGGAVYNCLNSILNLDGSVLASNSSEFEGGAIYNKARLSVLSSSFKNNASFKGGAIYNEDELSLEDCIFKGNIASDGNHIESENKENSSVLNCRFFD